MATFDEAKLALLAHSDAIDLLVEQKTRLLDNKSRLVALAEQLLTNERWLRATQALLLAMTLDDYPGRTSHSWIVEKLFSHTDFPFWRARADGHAIVSSANSSSRFARNETRTVEPQVAASYLVAIYLLHEAHHPCFEHHVAATLLLSNRVVDEVLALLKEEDPTDLQIRELVERGRSLLQYLGIDRGEHAKAISDVFKTSFFKDEVVPCVSDKDLGATKLGAVRLGTSSGTNRMFGSEVRLSLIVYAEEHQVVTEQHVAIHTYTTRHAKERLVSTGFMLVRKTDLVLFQHKVGAKGFNISMIPLSELEEPQDWLRGIMITVDTEASGAALASRMAVFHASGEAQVPMEAKAGHIRQSAAIHFQEGQDIGEQIKKHLLNEGPVVLLPSDSDKAIMTWGDVRAHLDGDPGGSFDRSELYGYRAYPIIRALG